MLFEELLFDDGTTEKAPPFPDQRLQSPIKPDLGILAFNSATCYPGPCPAWIRKTVHKMMAAYPEGFAHLENKNWSSIAGATYSSFLADKEEYKFKGRFARGMNIATALTDTFMTELVNLSWTTGYDELWQSTRNLAESRMIARWIKNAMMRTSRSRDVRVLIRKGFGLTFVMSRELVLIDNGTLSFFADYQSILLLCDVVDQRFLCNLGFQLYQKIYPDIYTVTEADLLDIYAWGDLHLQIYGNQAYDIIKLYEAICMSHLHAYNDPCNLSDDFRNSVTQSYEEVGGKPDLLARLHDVLKKLSPAMISECFGLFRIWGHPVVDEYEGCLKVQAVGKRIITPSHQVLGAIYACLAREFCVNFIRREGRWPALTFKSSKGNRIAALYKKGQLNWIEDQDETTLQDWEQVIFLKNFEFDYCFDFTQVIDDKAISTYRQHWDACYEPSLMPYIPPHHVESRRVMIEVLRREDLNIEQIMETVMRREVPLEWKIVGVHAKERELKIAPRLFAMMPLEMRLYFCVTEMNIAKTIFKYFPQQTMTTNESDLTARLLRTASTKLRTSSLIPVVINIDFEKWNLNWRAESMQGTLEFLDCVFGTPGLYTYSHEFFYSSMFHLVSRYKFPPNINEENRHLPPQSDILWYEDGSGKEGIRQKGWTLATVGALLYVETLTGVYGTITGQGDNQVIVAMFPVSPGMDKEQYIALHSDKLREQVQLYLKVLSDTFNSIGLPVKLEESWTHTEVFAYGKDLLYQGAVLPMAIKRVMRIMPDTNDVFPAISSSLSTIFSSGQAACNKGLDIFIPYFIAVLEAYLDLMTNIRYSLLKNGPAYHDSLENVLLRDNNFVAFTLSLPHALGGYPILTPLDYMFRGHSDPCTGAICALRILAKANPIYAGMLNYADSGDYFNTRRDYEMLILDPVALNWKVPEQSTQLLKRAIYDQFSSLCRNREIMLLFHSSSKDEDASLIDLLIKTRPLSPRFLNEVYRNSPSGARMGIIASVSHVRTVRNLAQQSNQEGLFEKVTRYEEQWMSHLFSLYSAAARSPKGSIGCSLVAAERWRSLSWFGDTSIELEGVSCPHPYEQFKLVQLCLQEEQNIQGILFIADQGLNRTCLLTHGKVAPYIGSLTQERKLSKIVNLPVKEPSLRSALRLQSLAVTNTVTGGYFRNILNQLTMSRTNIPLDHLEACADYIFAGTRTHRLLDVTTKHGGLINVRPNFNSHIYISTDLLGKYGQGFENYTINYQATILHYLLVLQYRFINQPQRASFLCKFSCDSCTKVINEQPVELPIEPTITFPSYSNSRLVYSRVDEPDLEHMLDTGKLVQNISPLECSSFECRTTCCYIYALQTILHADRAVVGHILGKSFQSQRSPKHILGIGEIKALGFTNLVLAIGHLNFLLYVLRYFNTPSLRKQLTVESLMISSYENIADELYAELRQAYPIESIRRQVQAEGWLPVDPVSASYGGRGVNLIINAILSKRLSARIRGEELLPALNCNTEFDWALVIQLNLLQKLCNLLWDLPINIDSCLSRACSAMKRAARLPSMSGSNMLLQCSMSILSSLRNCDDWADIKPSLGAYSVMPLGYWTERSPIKRAVGGLEQWLRSSSGLTESVQPETLEKEPICKEYPPLYCKYRFNVPTQGLSILPVPILDDPTEERVSREIKTRHDHVFRLDGVATALYKYYAIVTEFDIPTRQVICLGEGEGSIASMFLKIFNTRRLFYNSLLKAYEHPQHRYPHHKPAELMSLSEELQNRIYRYDITLYGENDLTTMGCVNLILSNLPWNSWSCITCDAESSKYGPIMAFRITRSVCLLSYNLLSNDGYLVYKTYLGSRTVFLQEVKTLSCIFRTVKVVIPSFSSFESTEVMLVCTKIHEKASDAISILLEGRYPEWIGLNDVIENLFDTWKKYRIESTQPFQYRDIMSTLNFVKFIRQHYHRPNWINSLYQLTGGFYNQDTSLEDWLKRRLDHLNRQLNMICTGLFDHVKYRANIDKFESILTLRGEHEQEMYRALRQVRHCTALIELLQQKSEITSLQEAVTIVDQSIRRYEALSRGDGRRLLTFSPMKNEYEWRKRYARHIYHVIGEIMIFKVQ